MRQRQRRRHGAVAAALLLLTAGAVAARGQDAGPDSSSHAKEIETAIVATAERVTPAFVIVSGGSGVIISDDGYALTNHHVVATRGIGERFRVRRAGGESLRATLVGTDPEGDIALLKLDSRAALPFVPLGDSDGVRTGDLAIALGNPYGLAGRDAEPAVTLGIVSAVHTFHAGYSDAIQTDAAINPGNSGGPLVSLRGELLGINGRVAVRFGNRMNTGVGYTIPSNQIRRFLPRLKEGGVVHHGSIPGLTLSDASEGGAGALVADVRPGSAADRAGFLAGDVIVGVDAREVRSVTGWRSAIGQLPAGDAVRVRLRRGEANLEIDVAVRALPARREAPRADLGLKLATEPANGWEAAPGAEVLSVWKGGPSDRAGIRAGDVLLRIDGNPIRGQGDLDRFLRSEHPGATVAIEVLHGGAELGFEVELGQKP